MQRVAIFALAALLAAPAMGQSTRASVGGDTAARAQVEVMVLNRAVARGERLSVEDFSAEQRGANLARGAVDLSAAVGMEVIRPLAAGAMVRSSDLISPRIVRRGEPVLIAYKVAGVTITTQGRALASAGAGEPVRVVANSTGRTLDTIVAGPGLVRVH